MTTQRQARARLVRAEAEFGASIKQIETFWEQNGPAENPLLQQTLEREYKRRQRALRAARTAYCTLANQHGWEV